MVLLAVRTLLILAMIFGLSFVGIFYFLLRPFHSNNSYIIAKMFSTIGIPILGLDVEVRDTENYPPRPYVTISNHLDNLDIIVIAKAVPPRTVTVGKKSILKIPFFGLFFWLAGSLFIDRGNKDKSHQTMAKLRDAMTKKKVSTWVMAEGTRSHGKGVLPFKKGAFHMANETNLPLSMVCVSNYIKHANFKKWRSGKVIAKVLPPISPSQFKGDITAFRDYCHDLMVKTVAELDREVLATT